MIERFNGNFTYSKKLMAIQPSTLKRDGNWIEGEAATLSNDKKLGMKCVNLGTMHIWLDEEDDFPMDDLVHGNRLRDTILRDVGARFTSHIKVHENTSFWLSDYWPLAQVVEQVEAGHAMLRMFLNGSRLPEEWDYWFSY